MTPSERMKINRELGQHGLAQLDNPGGLCQQLGFLVKDNAEFGRLIMKCLPEERRNMYEALRPHLSFTPDPLDVYIARAGADAEARQLPTIGKNGELLPFRVQEIGQKAIQEALAKHHLKIVCRKCTREQEFHGLTKGEAIKAAREAGWTYDEVKGDGREICPECPAVR